MFGCAHWWSIFPVPTVDSMDWVGVRSEQQLALGFYETQTRNYREGEKDTETKYNMEDKSTHLEDKR